MKIYLVYRRWYDWERADEIDAIFKSKDKAEKYIDNKDCQVEDNSGSGDYYIKEMETED